MAAKSKQVWWKKYTYTPYEWATKVILFVVLVYLVLEYRGILIAASVNGTPISRMSVITEIESQLGAQTLENLINQELIRQKAASSHVEVSTEELGIRISEIEESVAGSGQSLDSLLELQGMTRAILEDQIRTQLMVEKLLAGDIAVSDEEVSTYLEENKEFLPTDLPEEEVKQEVRSQLEQQKMAERYSTWVTELQNEAQINHYVDY